MEPHATHHAFGIARRYVNDNFLRGGRIQHDAESGAGVVDQGDLRTIYGVARLRRSALMDPQRGDSRPPPSAADIGPAGIHGPGDECGQVVLGPTGRNGINNLPVHHLLPRRALHVDDRRFARHGHRFFERSHAQVGVHRRDERARQLKPFATYDGEPRQCERHLVGTGSQIHDAVLATPVGHDRPGSFNERRTGRFDGNARQHRAGGVPDDTRNGCLGIRGRGDDGQPCEHDRRES
jgi:hypothetical protein